MNTDTPETESWCGWGIGGLQVVPASFARKLEREHDELQKAVNGLCNHLQVSPANTTLLAVEILKIERERDKARKQRDALADALENLLVTEGRWLDEWEREAFRQAKEVLAAVKGGSNE